MILRRNYFSIISVLALFAILLNLNNIPIYGQQSNAPFVTKNELQAALANVVTQDDLNAALANVVTQDDLNEEFDNLLVTVQQLIENQEPIIPECPTFVQLPGGQIFAELERDSSTRMIVGGPVANEEPLAIIGPVRDLCIVPPNAFQQTDLP